MATMTRQETRYKLRNELKASGHVLKFIDQLARENELNIRQMAAMRRCLETLYRLFINARDHSRD